MNCFRESVEWIAQFREEKMSFKLRCIVSHCFGIVSVGIALFSYGYAAVLGMTLNCIHPLPQGTNKVPAPVLSPDKMRKVCQNGWRYTDRKKTRRLKSAKITTQVTWRPRCSKVS